MAYIADPRGGATRDYKSVPKTSIDDPTTFDPLNSELTNDTTVNENKAYTDTLLYAVLFFVGYKFLTKISTYLQK